MNKLKRRNNNKNYLIVIILCLFVFMGIGFSFAESSFNFEGAADLSTNLWDIHFANLVVKTGSVAAITEAAISENSMDIPFAVKFSTSNQYYEFEVDIVNDGGINSKISSSKISGFNATMKKYMNYTVTYSDTGEDLKVGDTLLAGETKRIKVSVTYIGTADGYVYENVSGNLKFNVSYIQG